MKLSWLTSAIEVDGPYTTVHLDTTRTDQQSVAELEARWGHLRSALVRDGARAEMVSRIEETLLAPSAVGGRHGRTLIATDEEILVDRVLPVPPLEDSAHRGDHPVLLPLVRLTPYAVSQLLVLVDRAGADLHLRAPQDPSLARGSNDLDRDASVDGGHDVLHKTSPGGGSRHGWRADRSEARVEDSWERNADAVAEAVDRIVRERHPDMVLLGGDVRAMGLLQDALGIESRERLHEVPGGTRGVGLERDTFREEVGRATDAFMARRQQELLARFSESQGRDGASVVGADDVGQALARGQVEKLILVTGEEPAGIEELLLAALRTDAGISAVSGPVSGALSGAVPEAASPTASVATAPGVDIPGGVAALLRWKDGATPSSRIASSSEDGRRETKHTGSD